MKIETASRLQFWYNGGIAELFSQSAALSRHLGHAASQSIVDKTKKSKHSRSQHLQSASSAISPSSAASHKRIFVKVY